MTTTRKFLPTRQRQFLWLIFLLSCFVLLFSPGLITPVNAQSISFSAYTLQGESLVNPTVLQFGPDGRLYVSQQNGMLYAYTIQRTENGGNISYNITATEQITIIKNTVQNHNDDGTVNTTQQRQITGMMVTGTSSNPVLYVTSSDWRISVGNDSGLDTNSSIITRLTWTGSQWDRVDLVRGLARSEENHAINGLTLDESTNTLYVMMGGHTGKGAPSNNLSGTPEYWTSAAMLTVDLDALEAMPIYTDPRNGSKYIYDLPTLDDPTRPNITNTDPNFPYPPGHPMYNAAIDPGDPFGGNNGLNQAILTPDDPVQIYASGFRNGYDVLLTEAGRLYVWDNGPSTNWGGLPFLRNASNQPVSFTSNTYNTVYNPGAGVYCTNEFNESGGNTGDEALSFVPGEGYYGGHPAPIRAFPAKAGIYIYEEINGSWTLTDQRNMQDLIPAYITSRPGYSFSSYFPDDPEQCEYTADLASRFITMGVASTNGMAEYTASNFSGALQGDILAAAYDGVILRVELNSTGDGGTQTTLFSGFGAEPLDVIAQGDTDIFPGTIWAATYGADNITVWEPQDFLECSGTDSLLIDEDFDLYSNADEIDNNTNPCSGGSVPQDFDQAIDDAVHGFRISNLNDPDDDNDSILDINDAFAIDPNNGLTTTLPINYPFWNYDPGTGFFGVGFTGLMTNGVNHYLQQYANNLLTVGGAAGKFTLEGVPNGDALGNLNTQMNGFQFGLNVNSSSPAFTIRTSLEAPYFADPQGNLLDPEDSQSFGLYFGSGDQDNYLKIALRGDSGVDGFDVVLETNGTASSTRYNVANALSFGTVDLYFIVNPANNTAQPGYSLDGGNTIETLGLPVSIPASWFSAADAQGLAIGLISTSRDSQPFVASWDFLTVLEANPAVNDPIDDIEVNVNSIPTAMDISNVFVDDGGLGNLTFSIDDVTDPTIFDDVHISYSGGTPILTLDYKADTTGTSDVTIRATDSGGLTVTDTFTVTVDEGPGSCRGLVQEAEDGLLSGNFVIGNDATASGGQYVHVPNGTGDIYSVSNTHMVSYCFNIPQAGIYRISTKVYAANSGDDSFFVTVDGTSFLWDAAVNTTYATDYVNNRGVSDPVEVTLPAGPIALTVHQREDGARLDSITLELVSAPENEIPVADAGTYSPIADSDGLAGETVTLDGSASTDSDGTIASYAWTVNGTDTYTGVQPVVSLDDGANSVSLVVTDDLGADSLPDTTTINVSGLDTNPAAEVLITPNSSGWEISTFNSNSFRIINTGDVDITSVEFDLNGTYLPDIIFDPIGNGGDAGGKCFDATTGSTATGLTTPENPTIDPNAPSCTVPFSQPNLNLEPTDTDPFAGYFALTMNFNDFNPTESFYFAVDVDPNSIKGDPAGSVPGAISGMEMISGVVTINFSDGSELQAPIWLDATQSNAGGRAVLAENAPVQAPIIEMTGLPTFSTTNTASQNVQLTGPANASFTLLQVDARLHIVTHAGYGITPYEANESVAKTVYSGTFDSSGNVSVPVTLLRTAGSPEGGYNHFIAVVNGSNGQTSPTSNVLVIEYDPNFVENQIPVADAGGDQNVADSDNLPGETVILDGTASFDTDGSVVSYLWTVNGTDTYTGAQPSVTLNDGANSISLIVTDDLNADSLADTATITVEAPEVVSTCGPLVQEAENGVLAGNFVIGNDVAASGGQYVFTPNNSGNQMTVGQTHTVTYCFTVTQAGTYRINTNVYAGSSTDDSFFVTLNGQTFLWDASVNTTYATDYVSNRNGADPVEMLLLAGEYPLIVHLREDGARLDRIGLELVTPVGNIAPVANAGSYPNPISDSDELPGETLQLNGTASSDLDGTVVSYAWTVNGTDNYTGAQPTITLNDGANTVQLVVTDDGGAVSNLVQITINVASPGTCGSLVKEAETGTLNGFVIGAAPQASGGQYVHTPNASGNSLNSPNATSVSYCFSITQAGTYRIVGWVYAANSGDDSFWVTLNGSNYLWDFPANTTYNQDYVNNRSVADPVQVTLPVGEVTVSVHVREDGARLDRIALELVAPPANLPPVANAGADVTIADTDGLAGETLQLDGTASTDSDGTIVSYAWTVNGTDNYTGAQPTVDLNDGQNTINLVVTDDDGAQASDSQIITVDAPNVDPVVVTGFFLVDAFTDTDFQPLLDNASLDINALPAGANIRVEISGTISDVVINLTGAVNQSVTESTEPYSLFGDINGDFAAWTPVLGDYVLEAVPHLPGGADGTSLTINFSIVDGVIGENLPPTADAGADFTVQDTDSLPGESNVQLDGSGSTDPESGGLAYLWTVNGTDTYAGVQPMVDLVDGLNTITLVVTDGQGASSAPDTVNVTVVAPVVGTPVINGLVLVDGGNNTDFAALQNFDVLQLASLPSTLNIRADVNSDTARVTFSLTGDVTQNLNDGSAPFLAFAEFSPWTPVVGNYAIVATPYAIDDTPGTPVTVNFVITDPVVQLVSNLQVSTGKTYQVGTFGIGSQVYTDRTYTTITIPAALNGATYILTSNDDKIVTAPNYLSFTLSQNATVYVIWDSRSAPVTWLAGWTPFGGQVLTTDYQNTQLLRNIYSQSFSAGTVTLPGAALPSSRANYIVVVVPQG